MNDQRADIVEDVASGRRRLIGIAVDVTDRMREAEISATADQRLRDAIEAVSEAFVVWDSGNHLVLWNTKYQRLHNLPSETTRVGASYAELARLGQAPIVSNEIVVNPNDIAPLDGRSRTYQAPAPTRTAPQQTAPVQRSMTPQEKAAAPAAAPAAAGAQAQAPGRRGFFGGMGGGILGGLVAGGLLGMMLGHGWGGPPAP